VIRSPALQAFVRAAESRLESTRLTLAHGIETRYCDADDQSVFRYRHPDVLARAPLATAFSRVVYGEFEAFD
jgi:hypothetical protein